MVSFMASIGARYGSSEALISSSSLVRLRFTVSMVG